MNPEFAALVGRLSPQERADLMAALAEAERPWTPKVVSLSEYGRRGSLAQKARHGERMREWGRMGGWPRDPRYQATTGPE